MGSKPKLEVSPNCVDALLVGLLKAKEAVDSFWSYPDVILMVHLQIPLSQVLASVGG